MSTINERRDLLKGLMLVGGSAALAASPDMALSQPVHRVKLNLNDARDLSLVFRKLSYSMGDRLGFWHLSAIRYGLVGTKLIPFWEMHIGRFFLTRSLAGGQYEVIQMGLTYYTDVDTGEYLQKFHNPLTGKVVDIAYGVPKPMRYAPPVVTPAHYEAIGARDQNPAAGRTASPAAIGSLGRAWTQGDSIWIQQDHLLQYPAPGHPSVEAHVNDLTTYFGSLKEVSNPAVAMPRAGHAFNDINDWPSWLEMGDQPGAYFSRGVGFKAFSFDEMPAAWKALALKNHPTIAKDPLAALREGEAIERLAP